MILAPDCRIIVPSRRLPARCPLCGRLRIRRGRRTRQRPFMPLSPFAFGVADTPVLLADGTPGLMPDGTPAVDSGSGCPCCGGELGDGPPCSQCIDGKTPSAYSVSLINYTSCIGTCWGTVPLTYKWEGSELGIIGPWDVLPDASACRYYGEFPVSGVTFKRYNNLSPCGGTPTQVEEAALVAVTINLNAGAIEAGVELFTEFGAVDTFLHEGTLASLGATYDCLIERTIPNDTGGTCGTGDTLPISDAELLITPI